MKIISCNVNGIRAAAKKGFFSWLKKVNADVICLQETRCFEKDFPKEAELLAGKYYFYLSAAEKPGYSGVAIYSKEKPKKVNTNLELIPLEHEGRYLEIELSHAFVMSCYFPSGTSGDVRQDLKYEFLDHMEEKLATFRRKRKPTILCGDVNIAHRNIDIKNWRGNQKNSGFLPEEREWLDLIFEKYGYIDSFREVCTDENEYSWWSNRGRARENNVGWRIDYQIASNKLKGKVKKAFIFRDEKFSDHAPIIHEYKL